MRIFIANHWHSTPIHEACYENDILMLRSLLDSEMASQYISCRDHCGWMAIHVAAFMNRAEIFDLLLTRGANLFAITGGLRGFTTLHLACSRGHIEIIALSIAAAQSLTVHLSWTVDIKFYDVHTSDSKCYLCILSVAADADITTKLTFHSMLMLEN